jgi:protein-S-isoprenylcysteine O-methyltransferase Ste14
MGDNVAHSTADENGDHRPTGNGDTPTAGRWSELTAINTAKVVTIGLLLAFAALYGVRDMRQVVYLSLHISYCLWWLLEQWCFPERRRQLFTDRVGPLRFAAALLFIGVLYSLPGWLAFLNPQPISYATVAVALGLFSFGGWINTSADVQKMTAKAMGAGLVSDGIWRRVRHVNYLGDLLRYLSFAVVAGQGWAYLVPALVLMIYLLRIDDKERRMAAKYPEFAAYKGRSVRLLPGLW